MSSFAHKVDPREAQYARLAQAVLSTLRGAVQRRVDEDLTKKEIADRIPMSPSVLSRILSGRVKNITLKTLSDILWATEHEPVQFYADALEDISHNHVPGHLISKTGSASSYTVNLDSGNAPAPKVQTVKRETELLSC